MNYGNKSFAVAAPGTEKYRSNYDAIDWSDGEKKEPEPEQWAAIGPDDDTWTGGFESRADAIRGAPDQLELTNGDKFRIAPTFNGYHPVSASDIIDLMHERACDEHWGDSDYPDASKEAVRELDEFLKQWFQKHGIRPDWFEVDESRVEEHVYALKIEE